MAKKSRRISAPKPRRTKPAGGPKNKDIADDLWDGFPTIVVSPVRIISPLRTMPTLAHKLGINFGPDSAGNSQYMFALVSSLRNSPTEPACEPVHGGNGDRRVVKLKSGWIFVNKCFRGAIQFGTQGIPPFESDWPIIVGGRVSAGSDGSEFILELDNEGEDSGGRVYYVSSAQLTDRLYVRSGNGKKKEVPRPGMYAEVTGQQVDVYELANSKELLKRVQTITAAAELAGVRSAGRRDF